MLLLPLAAALFFDAPSKRLALKVLVVTCLVGALVSFATFATDVRLTERLDPGIVFHDYAVQGAAFSLAAIVCVAALIRPADFAGDRLLGNRVAMAGILVLLVIDVVFILWGRTGAFAIVLMSSATAVFLVARHVAHQGAGRSRRPRLRRRDPAGEPARAQPRRRRRCTRSPPRIRPSAARGSARASSIGAIPRG